MATEQKWMSETSWLAHFEATQTVKVDELEAALRDCPASVPLWCKFIENHEDISAAFERALASLAIWDLERGHLLWINYCKDESLVTKQIPYKQRESLQNAFPSLQFTSNAVDFSPAAITECKSIPEASKLSMIRCWHEQQLTNKPQPWCAYLTFLYQKLPVASVITEVARRFVRAVPTSVLSWQSLIDALLMSSNFDGVLDLQLPRNISSDERIQLSLLAARSRAQASDKPLGLEAVKSAPSKATALHLLTRDGDVKAFRALWKHSILKANAKDAQLWLEYINLEQAFGADDRGSVVESAFKQAFAAASDKKAVLEAWLDYERLNGDSLGAVTAREGEFEASTGEEVETKKRPRLEEEDGPSTSPPSSRFNPNATLFVNNLPFHFTEDQIRGLFADRQVVSLRMHMKNGNAFKGHATIEFGSPEEAAQELSSLNRKLVEGRPMFLAPYQSPVGASGSNAPPSALTTKDPKTLYASRLPEDVTADQLTALFSAFEGFKEVRHTPGKPFAYIEFGSPAEAARLLQQNINLNGNAIKLAISEPPVQRRADPQTKSKMMSMIPRSMQVRRQ